MNGEPQIQAIEHKIEALIGAEPDLFLVEVKIKKGFREMQSRMQEQMQQQQGFTAQPSPSNPAPKTKAGDYIDFEEVK